MAISSVRFKSRRNPAPWWERSSRALPGIAAPPVRRGDAREDLRPLGYLLVARTVAAVVAFVVTAHQGWWLVAIPLTWFVYGSALTCVHHLIHGSMGLSPRSRRFWLRTITITVAESGHALQVTHLAHHRRGTEVPDPEGFIENVGWLRIPFAALAFRYRLMWWGLRHAPPARRRRVAVEVAAHAALHLGSLALLPISVIPWIYLSSIHVASFGFAVLAGKGPQTNWGRPIDTPFVRVHTVLGRWLFFHHDLHLEHHAYPKVPLPRLRALRSDVDTALADVAVIDVRMPL